LTNGPISCGPSAGPRRPWSLGLPFSLWTLQRLVDYLAEHTRIRVSDETVRRALIQAGMVRSRLQHTISSPGPDYHLKKDDLKPGEVFYDADEFNLSSLPILRAMWSPQGQPVMLPTPGQPYKWSGLARSTTRRAKPWGCADGAHVAGRSPHACRRWSTRIRPAPSLWHRITRIRTPMQRSKPSYVRRRGASSGGTCPLTARG
jgi:hypothetical protein